MRAILDHFGGMLAPRWGHLGPSWGHGGMLGSCWCHGGPCWAMLGMEAMLSYVEAMLGPSWVQVGAVLGDVGGMWKPCGSYVGLAWAEDGCRTASCSHYGPFQPRMRPKTTKNTVKHGIFWGCLGCLFSFSCLLLILAPSCSPFHAFKYSRSSPFLKFSIWHFFSVGWRSSPHLTGPSGADTSICKGLVWGLGAESWEIVDRKKRTWVEELLKRTVRF